MRVFYKAGMKLVCVILVLFFAAGCSKIPEKIVFVSEMPEDIVLVVGEEQCSESQMRLLLYNNRNIYKNAYSLNILESKNEVAKHDLNEYVNNITLSHWTKIMSMNALAKEYGIELSETAIGTIDAAAQEYISSLSDGDVRKLGISVKDVSDMYRLLAVSDMVYEELTKDVSFEVSNDESRVMEVMIIYTADAETADIVESELEGGGDFGALAANYNDYRSIELNLYRDMLPKDVEDAAYQLEDGENTGRIQADDGYYFIYCIDKYNEELSNQNKQNIVDKRRTDAFNNIYELFEENVEITYNAELWKSIIKEANEEIETDNFFDIFDKRFISTRYK